MRSIISRRPLRKRSSPSNGSRRARGKKFFFLEEKKSRVSIRKQDASLSPRLSRPSRDCEPEEIPLVRVRAGSGRTTTPSRPSWPKKTTRSQTCVMTMFPEREREKEKERERESDASPLSLWGGVGERASWRVRGLLGLWSLSRDRAGTSSNVVLETLFGPPKDLDTPLNSTDSQRTAG